MMTGRCLCGAVRYAIAGAITDTAHCHCESCRRATSSPMTTFVTAPRDQVRFSGTPAKIYVSSPGVERMFCGTCGSPMGFYEDARPGEIDLYAASLDTPETVHPDYHVHYSERVAWIDLADTLPRHDKGSAA